MRILFFALLFVIAVCSCAAPGEKISLNPKDRIVLLGNNLCSRMVNYGHFETELFSRYPTHKLFIRNICDGGNTPGFRPHSGRPSPWPFPGADTLQTELANPSGSTGHFESPDDWLYSLKPDIILAFFGYAESFGGVQGLANFKQELRGFIRHTISQYYNKETIPKLVLISPIAFQDLSAYRDLPKGDSQNKNLALYSEAMQFIAEEEGVYFIDIFNPSKEWFTANNNLTIDGFQLSEEGYKKLAPFLSDQIFGKLDQKNNAQYANVLTAVNDKNWLWQNDFKIPNGVHVFGRRFNPFGPENYPFELRKIRQMTDIRDSAIWLAAVGETLNVEKADESTLPLPEIQTNYIKNSKSSGYLYGEEALKTLKTANGFKVDLFAAESDFKDLANPVQLSFDNKGRLWVAVMPSYPHYKPGDSRPDDKLLILEDTDNDGKADKQTIFARDLHLPLGFEFAPEGVYVSQGTNLVLLKDEDGDDQADKKEIILSGFDDHDTHHAHSAYCADPSGAIYMGEGVFLHTNVETAYGTVRATNGGFYRYQPQRNHLERTAQLAIPNPWGIAFDDWGQPFFAETSGPDVRWMLPGTVKSYYGESNHKSYNLIEEDHRVRPTSGLEFVSSRHFPPEVQGDMLINNTIGFLGMKMHQLTDDTTGFDCRHRLDLLVGSDLNFRPVDMEFAPDGSLYVVDWHNALVGHMQHNARDPLRDHAHGRVYRITYPSRPLVAPAQIDGAPIDTLLDHLKLPEYRTRYRTRRELRARDKEEVLSKLTKWVANLNMEDPDYQHHVLEALWVSWGLNDVDTDILGQVIESSDFRARAAAVRVIRYMHHQLPNYKEILLNLADDPHGRVRLEVIAAASWLSEAEGLEILDRVGVNKLDRWMVHAYETARAHVSGLPLKIEDNKEINTHLEDGDRESYIRGREIYLREAHCGTCHQENGLGLQASAYPPLTNTKWAVGNKERLIRLTLNGVMGPMEVLGREYPGAVPMTQFRGLLNDQEIADVLTYVRNSWGNKASIVSPAEVERIRAASKDKSGFYTAAELLELIPESGVDGKLVN